MGYFVSKAGEQTGPLSLLEVQQRVTTGTLSLDDLSWREGETTWTALRSRAELQPTKPEGSIPASATQPTSTFDIKRIVSAIALVLVFHVIVVVIGGIGPKMLGIPFDSQGWFLAVMGGNLVSGLIAFILAGLLFHKRRWIHLLFVWLGVCVVNLVISVMLFGQSTFIADSIWFLIAMGIGGWLSGRFLSRDHSNSVAN